MASTNQVQDAGMQHPILSIMIPTYNRFDTIKATLRSAINQQTDYNYSIAIVDNNPSNDSRTRYRRLLNEPAFSSVKYYQNSSNIGMYPNWNKCIELATTSHVTILNDDDLLSVDYVQVISQTIRSRPQYAFYSCNVELIDESNAIFRQTVATKLKHFSQQLCLSLQHKDSYEVHPRDYFFANRHCGSLGIAFSRSIFLKERGFKQSLYPISDYVFCTTLATHYKTLHLCRTLASYRIAYNVNTDNSSWIKSLKCDYQFRQCILDVFKCRLPIYHAFNFLKYQYGVAIYSRLFTDDTKQSLKTMLMSVVRKSTVYCPYLVVFVIARALSYFALRKTTAPHLLQRFEY
ncbi:glycosyltransferase family 2 protein [Synechococcus sp. W4D4]|uniref:glycosyltransferase family 2 protein n=1 Tax=Synechococcus sp. W4D4 TaxID=3392294 RepID=UPI0039EC2574